RPRAAPGAQCAAGAQGRGAARAAPGRRRAGRRSAQGRAAPRRRRGSGPGPPARRGCRAVSTLPVLSPRPRRGRQMTRAEIEEMFRRLSELNPNPTTELEYSTPFELLIAVILSAQATDVGVNKATRRLFPVANTPQAIADLGEEALKGYINTIGLYNAKAKNVIATCRILLERHGGEVPREREALEALPGVGRKTANVVLNTAFGEPAMAVDTHIFRVSNRT